MILADDGLPTTGLEALVALAVSAVVGYAMIDAIMKVVHEVAFWIVCVALGGLTVLGAGLTMVI